MLSVDDAEIFVADRSVFPGRGAELGSLRRAAPAEVLSAKRGVHPTCGGPVKFITEDEALAGAVPSDGDKEAGLPDLGSGRRSGIRHPDERNTEQAEVGVDDSHGLADAHPGTRRIKLPFGMIGITHGDPRLVNEVEIVAESLHQAGFEVKRIVRYEQRGIRPALDFQRAADVGEGATAGAHVVMGFIGFEMLIFEVVLDVAAGESFRSLVVVLDVIGTQALAGVMDINVIVSDEEIALAALRAFGGKLGNTAFGRGWTDLLGLCGISVGEEESKKEQLHGKNKLE